MRILQITDPTQIEIVTQNHLATNASVIIPQCTIIQSGKSHSLPLGKLATATHQFCQVHINLEGSHIELALINALLLEKSLAETTHPRFLSSFVLPDKPVQLQLS